MGIFLTTSALAGARAKNEHDRDQSSLIDQVWSEGPICEFKVCIYFRQIVPWLVQEQKINTIQFDRFLRDRFVSSMFTSSALVGARANMMGERLICELKVCVYF